MQPITVAIQGDKASFHEIAALRYYTQPISLLYCGSFEEVFEKLTSGIVDKAFVAVKNSNHGEIKEVERLLARIHPHYEGEYLLPIQQHIIGLPETNLSGVTHVVSHPIAISQSSKYIERSFPGVHVMEYHDTAAAVEWVKQHADPKYVAVGSERAAELHGLVILQESIQNDPNNASLFRSFSLK